jgi:hypothetical protein
MSRVGAWVTAVGMAVASVAVVVPPAEAQAGGGLTLTLSATTELRGGQEVTFEVAGVPDAAGTVVDVRQCDDPVPAGATAEEIQLACLGLTSVVTEGGTTVGGTVVVSEAHDLVRSPDGRGVDVCSSEPFACSVVALVRPAAGEPVDLMAAVPIDVLPRPVLVTGPGMWADEREVEVWLGGEPGATLRVAQCVDYQDVPAADACLPATEVTLSDTGRGALVLPVAAAPELAGRSYDCWRFPCEIRALDATGAVHGRATVPGSVLPGALTVDPSTGLTSGASVHARTEVTGGSLFLSQCSAAVLDGSVGWSSGCRAAHPWPIGGGVTDVDVQVFDTFLASGPLVTCADEPGGCVLALGTLEGGIAAYVPLTFAGPATATLSPATGLLDGEEMTYTATGLAAGQEYELVRCFPADWADGEPACAAVPGAAAPTASAEGEVTATVAAAQRFPQNWIPTYCRDQCSIGLRNATQQAPVALAEYAMAEGAVTVTPATGLADGQPVTVAGTDMMPTYAGPMIWFVQTGAWGAVQCGRSVVDDPTLLGLFTHCAGIPSDGPLDVTGSTFSLGVEVAATIEPILGGSVDCAAAPDACVVAVGRMEQDGSITLHTVPLAFGS